MCGNEMGKQKKRCYLLDCETGIVCFGRVMARFARSPSSSAAAAVVVPEIDPSEVGKVEEILGYVFTDKNLVNAALTHGSFYFPFKPKITCERLEFVGDAVLNCLVAREAYLEYPTLQPGPLTRIRAGNVDTENLARVAVSNGLQAFVRHKAPQLQGQIEDFMASILEYPIHSNGLVDPPKVLADIVESLLGAVFMDSHSSLDSVWQVFKKLAGPLINLETLGKHPVSELHELCQKRRMQLTFLKDKWVENTTVAVLVDDNLIGSATYGQKKEIAENRAAKVALDRLKEELAALDATLSSSHAEGSAEIDSVTTSSHSEESVELDSKADKDKESAELDSLATLSLS